MQFELLFLSSSFQQSFFSFCPTIFLFSYHSLLLYFVLTFLLQPVINQVYIALSFLNSIRPTSNYFYILYHLLFDILLLLSIIFVYFPCSSTIILHNSNLPLLLFHYFFNFFFTSFTSLYIYISPTSEEWIFHICYHVKVGTSLRVGNAPQR